MPRGVKTPEWQKSRFKHWEKRIMRQAWGNLVDRRKILFGSTDWVMPNANKLMDECAELDGRFATNLVYSLFAGTTKYKAVNCFVRTRTLKQLPDSSVDSEQSQAP